MVKLGVKKIKRLIIWDGLSTSGWRIISWRNRGTWKLKIADIYKPCRPSSSDAGTTLDPWRGIMSLTYDLRLHVSRHKLRKKDTHMGILSARLFTLHFLSYSFYKILKWIFMILNLNIKGLDRKIADIVEYYNFAFGHFFFHPRSIEKKNQNVRNSNILFE